MFANGADAAVFVRVVEEIVLPGAGFLAVDGGVDAALHEFAVELDFQIPRAFELLKNHFVHLAVRLDERGGENGEAAAFLTLAGGTEELAHELERLVVHAAGTAGPLAAAQGIIAPGETGEAVEQDNNIAPVLTEALGAFEHEFRHLDVTARGFVEGAGENLAAHAFHKVSHFLRALVDEQHDEFDLRVVLFDRGRDVLEQDGLAAAGRSADQPALALAQRSHDVHHARAEGFALPVFENDPLVGKERRELVERHRRRLAFQRVPVLDLEHVLHTDKLFAGIARGPGAHFEFQAAAQIEPPHHRRRQKHIVLERGETVARIAQDTHALTIDLENAVRLDHTAAPAVVAEDFKDELVLAAHAADAQAESSAEIVEFLHRLVLVFVEHGHRGHRGESGIRGRRGIGRSLRNVVRSLRRRGDRGLL